MKLTVIIPAYNEINTIQILLEKIFKIEIDKQIIIVDDNSKDGTRDVILNYKEKVNKIILHDFNKGKGAAIQSAQKYVEGDYVIIQDADLEYDPNDYEKLIEPLKKRKTMVVYGSRVLGKKRYNLKNFSSLSRVFFNHFLTILSNIINNQNLTDAHTCYKVFNAEVFNKLNLKEKRFGFCPEVTTKISKLGYKISEIPISYKGRSYEQGKKIGIIDGFDAIKCLIKYKFIN